jgi:hypothetical protein
LAFLEAGDNLRKDALMRYNISYSII